VLDYITELSAEQEEQERLDDDERYSDVDLQEEKVRVLFDDWLVTNTDVITIQSHSFLSCSREKNRQVENGIYLFVFLACRKRA
jgi:hypothetical protein